MLDAKAVTAKAFAEAIEFGIDVHERDSETRCTLQVLTWALRRVELGLLFTGSDMNPEYDFLRELLKGLGVDLAAEDNDPDDDDDEPDDDEDDDEPDDPGPTSGSLCLNWEPSGIGA